MAPWEENAWFLTPSPVYLSVVINTTGQLVQANSQRVGLLVAPNTGVVYVSPDTQLTKAGSVAAQQGIPVNANISPLWINQSVYGPLVQVEWRWAMPAAGTMALIITVIELILRDWPRDESEVPDAPVPNIFRYQSNPDSLTPLDRAVQHALRGNLFSLSGRNVYAK